MTNYELSVLLKIKDDFTAAFDKAISNVAKKTEDVSKTTATAGVGFGKTFDFLKNNWIALSVGINQAFGIIGTLTNLVGSQIIRFAETGAHVYKIETAFASVAKAVGVDAQKLINDLNRAGNELMGPSEIMAKTSRLLQEGIRPEQMVKLMELLVKMAPIVGDEVEGAFNRMSDGLVRGSQRALRMYIGIVDLEKEMEKYADSIGTIKTMLTEEARLQANATIAIEKMQEKTKDLGQTNNESADSFVRMKVQIGEFIEALQKAASAAGPIAGVIARAFKFVNESIESVKEYSSKQEEYLTPFLPLGPIKLDEWEKIRANVIAMTKEAEAMSLALSAPYTEGPRLIRETTLEEKRALDSQLAAVETNLRKRFIMERNLEEQNLREKYGKEPEQMDKVNRILLQKKVLHLSDMYLMDLKFQKDLADTAQDKLRSLDIEHNIELENARRTGEGRIAIEKKYQIKRIELINGIRDEQDKIYHDQSQLQIDLEQKLLSSQESELDAIQKRHKSELAAIAFKYKEAQEWDENYIKEYLLTRERQSIEIKKFEAKEFEGRVRNEESYLKTIAEQTNVYRGYVTEKLSMENKEEEALKFKHQSELSDFEQKYKDYSEMDANYTKMYLALVSKQEAEVVSLRKRTGRELEDTNKEIFERYITIGKTGWKREVIENQISLDTQREQWKRAVEDKRMTESQYRQLSSIADREMIEKNLEYLGTLADGVELAYRRMRDSAQTFAQVGMETFNNFVDAGKDGLSELFFDAWTGDLKNAMDYFRVFTNSIGRSFANMLAKQIADTLIAEQTMATIRAIYRGVTSFFSAGAGVSEISPGVPTAGWGEFGGVMMHGGGEVPALLQRGEYVIRKSAVNAETLPILEDINNGSTGGAGQIVNININAVDAESFVNLLAKNKNALAPLMTTIYKNNSIFRKALRGM